MIFLPPGTFGSVTMMRTLRAAGCRADVAFAETGTLPWLARKHGPTSINVTVRATRLPTGVYPARLVGACLRGAACGLPVGGAGGRRAGRRAAERRPGDPPAADPDERRAAGALRALGHPQRRHAAVDPARDQRAGRRTHRGAACAGLQPRTFPAARPLRERPLDVRRRAPPAGEKRRLARAHPAAAAPLHAGRRAHGPGLSGLGGRLGRRGHTGGGRPAGHRRCDLRAGPAPGPAHAGRPGPGGSEPGTR